jgi:hypothetical protein
MFAKAWSVSEETPAVEGKFSYPTVRHFVFRRFLEEQSARRLNVGQLVPMTNSFLPID